MDKCSDPEIWFYGIDQKIPEGWKRGKKLNNREQWNQEFYKYTDDVSKIIEYENMYIIVFSGLMGIGIIAQKDLLVEGILEEFEKLFDGKIIRKY